MPRRSSSTSHCAASHRCRAMTPARGTSSYGDAHGREIDFHVIELDAEGNGQLGPNDCYPAAALAGGGHDRRADGALRRAGVFAP